MIYLNLINSILFYKIPKSGFINVNDYANPKELADYLLYLDRNKTAYNSYFKWKKHISYLSQVQAFNPICNMCIQLHLESYFEIEPKIIRDIADYWSKSKNCKTAKSF